MEPSLPAHFVLVDFENVQDIDLALVESHPVQVVLCIGKSQQRLELGLVRQIHRQSAQVTLVDVGASGRNALDLTLSFYLGERVAKAPSAEFCIVSKDKDFDPMISHLTTRAIKVGRYESFAGLPFLPAVKQPAAAKKPTRPVKSTAPHQPESVGADDKLQKLTSRLKNNLGPRPKRKDRLLSHIGNAYGNKLSAEEQADLLQQLIAGGVLRIDAKDNVTY